MPSFMERETQDAKEMRHLVPETPPPPPPTLKSVGIPERLSGSSAYQQAVPLCAPLCSRQVWGQSVGPWTGMPVSI